MFVVSGLLRCLNADVVILKNGKRIQGRIVREDDNSITVLTPTMSIVLRRSEIGKVERDPTLSKEGILGDIAFEDKQYADALAYYRAALKKGKNLDALRSKIESITKIQEAEVRRRFGERLKQAERLITQKQFKQAENLLKQILTNLPDESLAKPVRDKLAHLYYMRALEYRNTVDDLKAEAELKKAIAISDGAYEAHLLYAGLLARNPRTYDEAIKHYLRGIEGGANALSPQELARYHRRIALLYEQKKQYQQVIEHYMKVLELEPVNYPDTRERIVRGYLNLAEQIPESDFAKRRDYLLEAVKIDPFSADAHFALVSLYYNNSLINETLKECDKLINLNSRMRGVHYYLAMCHLKRREYEKAREALERELSINPGSYQALCALGDYFLNGGKYKEAITYYEKARDIRQEKYRAYIGLTRAYRRLDKPDKARENLDQIFTTNPTHLEATILSGALYKDAKEFEKARKLFDNVVTRLKERGNLNNPDTRKLLVEALNQRGELNLLRDSYRIAIADFRESLKYQPDYAEAYYNIARVYTKMGRFFDAEKNYFKAQSLDPRNPRYYLGLGIMYHINLKRKEKAIENYTKYIELGGEDFEKVNQWIKECGGKPIKPKMEHSPVVN